MDAELPKTPAQPSQDRGTPKERREFSEPKLTFIEPKLTRRGDLGKITFALVPVLTAQ